MVRGVSTAFSTDTDPKRPESVDTTLSFAITPVIRETVTLQSPNPSGMNIGAMRPEIMARMLSELSSTTLNLISKVWSAHIAMVATNMIVKALSRKSLAFSHRSIPTFLAPGIL